MKGRHVKTHMEQRDEALDRAKKLLSGSIGTREDATVEEVIARAQVEATLALAYAVADLHGTILKIAFDVGAIARER